MSHCVSVCKVLGLLLQSSLDTLARYWVRSELNGTLTGSPIRDVSILSQAYCAEAQCPPRATRSTWPNPFTASVVLYPDLWESTQNGGRTLGHWLHCEGREGPFSSACSMCLKTRGLCPVLWITKSAFDVLPELSLSVFVTYGFHASHQIPACPGVESFWRNLSGFTELGGEKESL